MSEGQSQFDLSARALLDGRLPFLADLSEERLEDGATDVGFLVMHSRFPAVLALVELHGGRVQFSMSFQLGIVEVDESELPKSQAQTMAYLRRFGERFRRMGGVAGMGRAEQHGFQVLSEWSPVTRALLQGFSGGYAGTRPATWD